MGSEPGRIVVRARGLEKARGGRALWVAQTFSVVAGTSLGITGPSGVGKTTLLNCIGLLERSTGGSLELDGQDVTRASRGVRRFHLQQTLGHLLQDYGLVESWSVARNLDLAFIGRSVSKRDRQRARGEALERVNLARFDRRPVHSLSGGEQQRVALARLLVRRPVAVLADEPSAALDDSHRDLALSVLADLRDKGAAVIVATHDDKVSAWCDDMVMLRTKQ